MKFDRWTALKAAALVLFLAAAVFAFRNPALRSYLSKEVLQSFVAQFGIFGPAAFVLLYMLAVILILPSSVLTIGGALMFGPWLGTLLSVAGATAGACVSFFLSRRLGRDFARQLAWKRLQRYDEKLERHGFATVLYLRMILIPFAPLNYGAGLTRVKFADYLFGTALGILPATFILSLFTSQVTSVSSWRDFATWEMALALLLFVGMFFVPSLVKKFYKKEHLLER
jgi:uncharacterized membrane protein YdjX (TVP38/TMEM64 family)